MNAWDFASIGIKAATYAATFGAAGGVLFLSYNPSINGTHVGRRIRRLIGGLAVAAAVATCVRFMVLMGSMSDDAAGMFDLGLARMLASTAEGRATAIRIVGLALLGLALCSSRRFSMIAVGGAVAAATSFAWVGHAQALAQPLLPVLKQSTHLLCVAFWLGALGPLLILARDGDVTRLAFAAARFGRVAIAVVSLLIFAGVSLLWQLLGPPTQLWSSDYGRIVSAKLGLVACLLGLAALNRWRLIPRLLAGDSAAVQSLARSIQGEMLIGSLILLVTATLTTVFAPSIDM
jgi:copper resistance protein D